MIIIMVRRLLQTVMPPPGCNATSETIIAVPAVLVPTSRTPQQGSSGVIPAMALGAPHLAVPHLLAPRQIAIRGIIAVPKMPVRVQLNFVPIIPVGICPGRRNLCRHTLMVLTVIWYPRGATIIIGRVLGTIDRWLL